MNTYYEENVKTRPLDFQYMLLSRLQADCKYYLGNGGRNDKHLFMLDPVEQIWLMNDIHHGLKEKPEWLSLDEIAAFESQMIEK